MRKDGVSRMLWLRHRWLYALVIIITLGAATLNASAMVHNYHNAVTYARSLSMVKTKTGKRLSQAKYARHLKEQATIYHVENKRMLPANMNTSESGPVSFMLAVAALLGVALVAWDRMSRFERFVFSSRFSRRKVYWHRLLQGLVVLLVATTLYNAIQFGWGTLAIPARFFNISLLGMIELWGYNLIADAFLYVVAMAAAVVFGRVIATLVFGGLALVLLDSLPGDVDTILCVAYNRSWPYNDQLFNFGVRNPGDFWIPISVVLLLLGMLIAWGGSALFDRITAENTTHILAVLSMKWVIIATMTALVAVSGMSALGVTPQDRKLIPMGTVGFGILGFLPTWFVLSYNQLRQARLARQKKRMKAKTLGLGGAQNAR